MGTLAEAASWYARHGWRVLPVMAPTWPATKAGQVPGKTPSLAGWQDAASTDAEQVARWWAERPDANIGIATGPGSGIWVLDIDPRHGGDESLSDLEQAHGRLPDTVMALTGGGGVQYVFRWPEGREVRTRSGIRPGIDVRGAGGQVVVAPSIHPSGRAYAWELSSRPGEIPLADAPDWLLDLVGEDLNRPAAPAGRGPLGNGGPVDPAVLRSALTHLDPDPYDNWILVGAILHDTPGIDGWVMWAAWSSASPKWDPEVGKKKWDSFGRGRGQATVGTIYALARRAGWQRPRARQPLPSAQAETGSQDAPAGGPPGARGSELETGPCPDFELNERGNAERLLHVHGEDLLWCHTWGFWLVWRGTHWSRDDARQVNRWMDHALDVTCRRQLADLEEQIRDLGDANTGLAKALSKKAETLEKWRIKNRNRRAIENSVEQAASLEAFSAQAGDFDREEDLFSVLNGTIDLRTGELRPHRREDRITRCAQTHYDQSARIQRWDDYLDQLTGGDRDLIAYLARAAGYSLGGSTREQVVFLLHGPGGTGKSTLLSAMAGILGSYADTVPFDIFLTSATQQRKWTLAKISQARLISCEESAAGKVLADDVLKLLTGGTPIEAEAKFANPFTYHPHFKVWLVTNTLPRTNDTDEGVWRRMQVIHCPHKPKHRDKDLAQYLTTDPAARAAVLAWMVAGAVDYHQRGDLDAPAAVKEAVQAYRDDQNPILDYCEERTVSEPHAVCTRAELRADYEKWCLKNGVKPLHHKSWTERLRKAGCSEAIVSRKDPETGRASGRPGWSGIRLRTEDDDLAAAHPPETGRQAETGSETGTSPWPHEMRQGDRQNPSMHDKTSNQSPAGRKESGVLDRNLPVSLSSCLKTPWVEPDHPILQHGWRAGRDAAIAGEPPLRPEPPAPIPQDTQTRNAWQEAWTAGWDAHHH